MEFTSLELAEKVMALTGSKSKISFKSLPSEDPRERQPDITLAKKKLGWNPDIKLEERMALEGNGDHPLKGPCCIIERRFFRIFEGNVQKGFPLMGKIVSRYGMSEKPGRAIGYYLLNPILLLI